jgi:hypothetical protein
LSVLWNLGVTRVALNTVDEVGLLVVVRGEDDEVNDALEDLENLVIEA